MAKSPVSIPFSTDGVEIAVKDATTLPTDARGQIIVGLDGSTTRFITVDSSGRVQMVGAGTAGTPAGGVVSIQGVASGTVVPVSDGGGSLTVDGTVTSNQGTPGSHANRWMVGLSDGSGFISPATDRTTAGAPFSVRLSDGSAFYVSPSAAQLPAALVGGRLDVNLGAWLGSTAPTVGQKTMANSIPFVVASDQSTLPVKTEVQIDYDTGAGTQSLSVVGIALPASGGAVAGGTSTNPVRVDPTGTTTQPVSGTVTANIGTSGSLALDATLTGNNQRTRITDGTNLAAVKAASTAAVATDPALVVAISPNNTVSVSGTVTANQGTAAALSGRWPVTHTDGTNSMPTGDAAARGIFHRITDGTNSAAVKAASTAAVVGDPALVVAISPNNTVAVTQSGSWTNTVTQGTAANLNATVAQGAAAALSGRWPVIVTDGTNSMPTGDAAARGIFHRVTDGTNTAAVKAASTAAVAGDPSLVVGLSPNSPLPTGANTIGAVTGPGASGAAVSGNPVRIAGSDGTNTRNILTDTTGRVQVVGGAADGAAVGTAGNPVLVAGSDGTNVHIMSVDDAGNASVSMMGLQNSSFSPDPFSTIGSPVNAIVDFAGNLQTRGQVLSDEGSLRDDFAGSGLTTAWTGTVTFTNGVNTISGSGTAFTTELSTDRYIKKTADAETVYVRVAEILSDTSAILDANYTGTTASTTAVASNWITTTPAGGSITVSNSEVLLAPSTANGNIVRIRHEGDYPPYVLAFRARITQRIANQTTVLGFQDIPGSPQKQAVLVFDGTSNSTVKFRTSFSSAAADTQESVVTLTTGLDTSQTIQYQIDLSPNMAVLSINGSSVATHTSHIPGPYDVMFIQASVTNAAVVTATTLGIDSFFFSNLDQLQVTNAFVGEPIKVTVVPTTSSAGFAPGYVSTSATTLTSVRATAYIEQTTNAQRSIASANAADTAAGTGARSVKITYFDQTGSGPYTETITLNGTAFVNTTNTNICYIEGLEVVTVGSGGANAGILTLKAATAGGGATIGTIAVGDNRTFWTHHYTPTGKTTYITGTSTGHNGTTVGSGALFIIRAISIGVANAVEKQVTDFIRLYGQSSTFSRNYGTPIQIAGPSRITMYVTPETSTATVYRGSFDYYDQ